MSPTSASGRCHLNPWTTPIHPSPHHSLLVPVDTKAFIHCCFFFVFFSDQWLLGLVASEPCWFSLFYTFSLSSSFCFSPFLYTVVSAERRVLQPSDCVYSESLTPQGKLVACRRDLTEILVCKCTVLFVALSFNIPMCIISTDRGKCFNMQVTSRQPRSLIIWAFTVSHIIDCFFF